MPTPKKIPTQTFHVPGLTAKESATVITALQDRLFAYTDLHLVLKHVHWNVVGSNFIGVHEMLDPQVDAVRGFADVVAERIATMGGAPIGTPGALVAARSWDDYEIGKDTAQAHLGALDLVYTGVIEDNRAALDTVGEIDAVTEDMLIGQTGELEQFHWFVRAHLENSGGRLSTEGATTEVEAADAAREPQRRTARKSARKK
ncbi:Dps family protein [Nocardioides piscis]|uniref:DNA starvation/stationary phase protection protein n=1 Tax=Nocardioides piscis TaxID=2714938 RepID=A0A6G7YHF4_9ACTN|nr:DNA starvation/stationary phase protection protein [Nocardioides piscis]QIK76245.1 DNA starvation/stationary phase protection protein [Nocardioides piscis]